MQIDADGNITVTGDPSGCGCSGTIRSLGDHKPHKITLVAGCDTDSPAAGSELDAKLDDAGNRLTVTTTVKNAALGTLTASSWSRRS